MTKAIRVETVNGNTTEIDSKTIQDFAAIIAQETFPAPYILERQDQFPAKGDQLDAIYKARQKRRAIVMDAQNALNANDLNAAVSLLLEAVKTTEEENSIDAIITRVKREVPKDWQPGSAV